MSKTKWILIVVLALVMVLGVAGLVSAQTQTPQDPNDAPGWGFWGMMGGRGHHPMMWGSNTSDTQPGLLHDEMVSIMAEKFGLSVEDLNARLEDGETMAEIAFSLDWTFDDFRAAMLDARTQAAANLVEDGTLTQDQADWLSQRGAGMMGGGRGGMRQNRSGDFDCPMFDND